MIETEVLSNSVLSNRSQIVITISRPIWNQPEVRLVPNQPDNGKYNGNTMVIQRRFVCVNKLERDGLNESATLFSGNESYAVNWPSYFFSFFLHGQDAPGNKCYESFVEQKSLMY